MKYGLYPSTIVKFNVNKIKTFQNLALHKLQNPPPHMALTILFI